MIKRARALLTIVYLFLLLHGLLDRIGTCEALSQTDAKPSNSDVMVAFSRQHKSTAFDGAAFFEFVSMSCLLGGVQLPVLPIALLVDAIAVRGRHIGFGSCTPFDNECCDALHCFEFPACTSPPFLASITDWNNRLNYCPLPYFYYKDARAKFACGTLSNTPDMASCYRYGCSRKHTPYQYFMVRVMFVLLVVISLLYL